MPVRAATTMSTKENFNPFAAMKKLMKSLVLFAAAAMALTSCENEAMNEGIEANDTYTMTFVAGAPESRTSVDVDIVNKTTTFAWSEKEQVAFVQSRGSKANRVDSNKFEKSGETATFGATFSAINDATGNYNYIAVYPSSNYATDNLTTDFANDKLRVEIPANQTLTANSFDPKADLMVSRPISAASNITTAQSLEFTRLAAIGRMNLKGVEDGENIEKIVFTIGDASTKLVGRHTIKFTDGTINEASYHGTNTITLTTPLNGEFPATKTGTPIYFTCLEGNYSGAYSVEVTTNLATYSTDANKSIAKENALSFKAGDVLGFNLTVGNRVERDFSIDYSGEYVIVAKRSTGNFFYMTPDLGTASTKRFQAVDTGVSTLASVTTNADYVWTVAKDGNTYTLAAPNGQFASWTSGNSAALSNDAYALNIEQVEGQEYYKISSASTTARIIALNSSNNYFAFYEGSGIQDLYLVPNIVETKTLQSIAVSGQTTEYTVDDTFNFDGTVTATYTGDTTGNTYTAVIAEGYTVSEPDMTQAAENVEVTVTYEGKTASYTVTVKEKQQADAPAWTLVTSLNDITADAKYILVANGYALANTKGSKGQPLAKAITISNNTLVEDSNFNNAQQFNIVKGTDTYTITVADGTNYLYCTNDNNGLRIDTTADEWKITSAGTNVFYFQDTKQSRYLSAYNNQDWRCYTGTGTGVPKISIYKLASNGEEPETPATPTKLEMSTVSCTAQTETSLTFSWSAVANASGYEVYFDSVSKGTVNTTSYTATGLTAGTSHTIAVKAVGTGNYTTSDAKTVTGTTKSASVEPEQPGDEQTITETQNVYANKGSLSNKVITWDFTNFTLSCAQGSNTNAIRTTDTDHFRAYQGNNLVFTAKNNKKFTKIVITCTSPTYATAMKNSLGSNATASGSTVTWTGSADKISVEMSAQSRFNKVVATIE